MLLRWPVGVSVRRSRAQSRQPLDEHDEAVSANAGHRRVFEGAIGAVQYEQVKDLGGCRALRAFDDLQGKAGHGCLRVVRIRS